MGDEPKPAYRIVWCDESCRFVIVYVTLTEGESGMNVAHDTNIYSFIHPNMHHATKSGTLFIAMYA